MPNWVHNTLTVWGKPQDIAAFKLKAAQDVPNEEPDPMNFHNLVPVPNELRTPSEARIKWEDDNWGCRGACECKVRPSNDDSEVNYTFDTAWNPPIRIFQRIAHAHPELLFLLNSGSGEAGLLLDVTIWGDHCDIQDYGWVTDAQMACTCGCFDKVRDIETKTK